MIKQVGSVSLDYTFYRGEDLYTDGEIEDMLLEACENNESEKLLYSSNQWPVLYHFSDIRENLLEWYPFTKEDDVLEIGSGCGAISGVLSRKAGAVTCIELSEKRSLINAHRNKDCDNIMIMIGNFQDIEPRIGKYDYITLIGVWEYSELYIDGEDSYLQMLAIAKKHLKPGGKIIIAIENKMGLKYWNGAPEDHTGQMYGGMNDYVKDRNRKVRTFSKMEIVNMLKRADLDKYTFYYPMPDYKLPETIYSDQMLPMPGMERNFGKDYSAMRVYNFNDAIVSDQISHDGMFPYFSNSFLVVAGEEDTKTSYAKYSRCRRKEFRIKTEICDRNGRKLVRKAALNELAKPHILKMKQNEEKWKNCFPKLKYVEGWLENDEYVIPYIEGMDLDVVFYEVRNQPDKFVGNFIYYVENYLKPQDEELKPFQMTDKFASIFGETYPDDAKSLKVTNIDLIFSNLKITADNQLYCFDYEWVFDFPIPYKYVIWRSAWQLYGKFYAYLKGSLSAEQFLEMVGLRREDLRIYAKMDYNLSSYVYGENMNEKYPENYRKSVIMQDIRFL